MTLALRFEPDGGTPPPLGLDPDLEPLLDSWRAEGRSLMAAHRAELAQLIDLVEADIARGRLADAAAWAQVSANFAVQCHPGSFVSPRLERALRAIGVSAIPTQGATGRGLLRTAGLHVLHVFTEATPIGGHVRNVERWIAHDGANRHSVALTRQHRAVPVSLATAVHASRGEVHLLNGGIGGLLAWARGLQRSISDADLVVLHAYNNDVIPFLALAGMRQRPPVVFVDHADHLFWLGAAFSDLVVNTRFSGRRLAERRRGVPSERLFPMPLCLEAVERRWTGFEAKRAIGLPEDAVMVLSVARGIKFRPLGSTQFPDPLVPLLVRNPDLHLVVVGADAALDWSAAEAAAPGRIHRVAETPDTSRYFAAADIYVDSFPFVSITSLLEAGLHGLPLVTRAAFGPTAEVMAADSIGLDGLLLRVADAESLREEVARLASDEQRRQAIGDRTRRSIEATNTGDGWRRALRALYERCFAIAPGARVDVFGSTDVADDTVEDIDLFTPFVYGDIGHRRLREERRTVALSLALKCGPTPWRLRQLGRLWRDGHVRHMPMSAWRQALPEWATIRLRRALARQG